MESEIILALKNMSLETFIIALIVFALTMILKLPIKKYTSRFNNDKRRAINTIIIFIPALLSLLLSILYFGIFKKTWFCLYAYETSLNTYFLSLTIYAIFSRLLTLFKGIKSGKVKINSAETKNTLKSIQNEMTSFTKFYETEPKDLNYIASKIQELKILKESILKSNTENSLVSINDINSKLTELEASKIILENENENFNEKGEHYE